MRYFKRIASCFCPFTGYARLPYQRKETVHPCLPYREVGPICHILVGSAFQRECYTAFTYPLTIRQFNLNRLLKSSICIFGKAFPDGNGCPDEWGIRIGRDGVIWVVDVDIYVIHNRNHRYGRICAINDGALTRAKEQ